MKTILLPLLLFCLPVAGQTVLITENAEGWAYLQSLEFANPANLPPYPDDVDPAVHPVDPDPDFDETWNDQSIGGYTGTASYDGPPFITGAIAPFSYGGIRGIGEGEGTTLTYPQNGTRHTAWFLKEVDGGASGYSNLTLRLLADDGAFVYLNGRLIANKNMPVAGNDTWALFSATKGSESDSNQTLLNDPVLTPGPNLLAVSVHQEDEGSSDFGLKLELSGDVGLPDLAFLGADEITKTTATVRWVTTSAGDSTLRFGVAPGIYDTTLNVPGSVTSHEVALTGLLSDTTYFIEAETDDGGSFNPTGTGSFTTVEGPNDINLSRGPYLQSASHDRITFRWKTSQLGDSTVHYGTTPESLTSSVTVPGSTEDHTVSVTGLAADTKYYYQIETDNGGGGNWVSLLSEDYFFETSPSLGAKHPTRVWVIGDSGTADSNAKRVYDAFRGYNGQDHTDVWLMLGDNAYSGGTQEEYQEAVFHMYPELLCNTPLWSTLGNHDEEGPYLKIFDFPTGGECGGVASGDEKYYSFDHGNIHFVCLDSESGSQMDELGEAGMADWLQSDLEATNADWIVAFYHHGPYTKGSHDSDTGSHHIAMRANTLSILEDYGVDLILSGHSHCYERSHLIDGHYGHSSTYNAGSHGVDTGNGSEVGSIDGSGNFISSGADGAYQKPLVAGNVGQISAIVGASGKLSSWDNGSSNVINPAPHPVFVANLRVLGSMVIDVDGGTLHAVYLDDNGNERDDFTILKGSTFTASTPDNLMVESGSDSTAGFSLTRTGAIDLPLTLDYVLGGSADASDYTPTLSGTVSFAIGETTQALNLAVSVDALAEGAETLTLTLIPRLDSITGTSADRDTYFIGASGSGGMTLADKSSQNWWFTHFGAASLLSTDWGIDHDGDTFNALMEYALGGDPEVSDLSIAPTLVKTATTIELHYTKDNALSDVSYEVQASTNLQEFSAVGVTDSLDGPANPSGPEDRKASIPIAGSFGGLRLNITMP